ncbi:hypothetical protein VTO58DRAFT_107801 [Aureobasidium pullulans]|nr:hypothetical protein JADG_004547 [Aureobasidium pullulans]THX85635.1 hypothetical protein D6D05_02774 [Aureobasidium pullulans]TIA18933.1 hypothetical protein D6C80_03116 [Aureobasidium pullulans]
MSFVFTSYFDRFPSFIHNSRCSVRDEFNRLAKTQKWDDEEKERQRAKCYNEELDSHFAKLNITSKLERLQHLCVELDVEPLDTICQCKKALKKIHVNLVDLMNARRTKKKVRQFATCKQLVKYTLESNKVYPKKDAKSDVVQVLLKHIFFHRK